MKILKVGPKDQIGKKVELSYFFHWTSDQLNNLGLTFFPYLQNPYFSVKNLCGTFGLTFEAKICR